MQPETVCAGVRSIRLHSALWVSGDLWGGGEGVEEEMNDLKIALTLSTFCQRAGIGIAGVRVC